MVTVRYASRIVNYKLCAREGFPGGVWLHTNQDGDELQFASELEAKAFLIQHGYDLPGSQTVFATA